MLEEIAEKADEGFKKIGELAKEKYEKEVEKNKEKNIAIEKIDSYIRGWSLSALYEDEDKGILGNLAPIINMVLLAIILIISIVK